MSTFATPSPINATVEVAGAQVRLTASDRADTVVTVEPVNPASRTDVKVAANTKVEFAAGRLSVKTTTPGDKNGSVTITVALPAGSAVAAYLAHSVINADGPLGRVELHQASGQARLDRAGDLHANIASGQVEVGRVAGRASIDGGAFDMRIGQADGPLTLSSAGGQAWIGHATAGAELTAGRGDFDIDRADGNVTATTGHGAIRIGQLTAGQAKLTNGSGNIEVGISAGAAASVDAHSERGAVHDFVSSRGNDDPSGPKVMVHARTRHGDIIVQRAAS